MPSSHSAAVASLATAVGLSGSFSSKSFAISAVVGAIIMFDAAGVRRHVGEQAAILNRLMEQLPDNEPGKALKELLGHRPIEVFMGGLLGIGISFLIRRIFY